VPPTIKTKVQFRLIFPHVAPICAASHHIDGISTREAWPKLLVPGCLTA